MTQTSVPVLDTVEQAHLTGERAMFRATDTRVRHTVFDDGESPLKESSRIEVADSVFAWKYPLWYPSDVLVRRSTLTHTARSGLWYADGVRVSDTTVDAPKTFRRASRIHLDRVDMPHADETLWHCDRVTLTDVSARGDYFAMNSTRVQARDLRISGNYAFNGARGVEIDGARIISKDAFWNTSNVTVRDAVIVGEYLGWNSSNLTFENCTIVSLQGMCYVDDLTLRGCRLIDTTLAFEYSTVDVESTTKIDSVLNPRSGVIRAPGIGSLTLDPAQIDPTATVTHLTGDADRR